MPNRHQAIIWTVAGLIYWCIYASLSLDELTLDELTCWYHSNIHDWTKMVKSTYQCHTLYIYEMSTHFFNFIEFQTSSSTCLSLLIIWHHYLVLWWLLYMLALASHGITGIQWVNPTTCCFPITTVTWLYTKDYGWPPQHQATCWCPSATNGYTGHQLPTLT